MFYYYYYFIIVIIVINMIISGPFWKSLLWESFLTINIIIPRWNLGYVLLIVTITGKKDIDTMIKTLTIWYVLLELYSKQLKD